VSSTVDSSVAPPSGTADPVTAEVSVSSTVDSSVTPPSVTAASVSAEAAVGSLLDLSAAPPNSGDIGFHHFLRMRGLAPSTATVRDPTPTEVHRDMGTQTTDPRVISPLEYVTYRQSFDSLTAATHMALLIRAATSIDATTIADQTAIRLGLSASDQPSWDALYRMAITAIVVERHLQVRLAEILAASSVDSSGALAIAGVLVDMQARQRRPWDTSELPQPGDSHELFAIMPPDDI